MPLYCEGNLAELAENEFSAVLHYPKLMCLFFVYTVCATGGEGLSRLYRAGFPVPSSFSSEGAF